MKREKVETNFLRPRYTPTEEAVKQHGAKPLKALITVSGEKKGHLCWGVVDDNDNFIAENQQLRYNPYTGRRLPATVEQLKQHLGGDR
tara:strand:- start:156 stop:419 length:264 start_codon:yes stop_codon:yes gene_type:complete